MPPHDDESPLAPGQPEGIRADDAPRADAADSDFIVPDVADLLAESIIRLGRSVGLDRVGICDVAILDRARRELIRRRAAGLADSMQFTYRNPERSTDPGRALNGALALIVGARRYVEDSEDVPESTARPLTARVARYAQADHYAALRESLEKIAAHLRALGHRAAVFVDENDIVDREVAFKAGIGWFGKSANILVPGGGSWYVLGSVVTSAPLRPTERRIPDGCGTCRVCIDACPTEAIVADGVIDARRCLAWLVQKEGTFPFEFRVALGDRIYGCDDCQETCPPNVRFLGRHRPTAIAASPGPLVDVFEFLDRSDDELMSSFGRWYIAGRNPTWLRRNALIILGNVAPIPVSERVRRTIEAYLGHPDPYLRAHALWAGGRLGMQEIASRLDSDDSELVQDELRRWSAIPVRKPE